MDDARRNLIKSLAGLAILAPLTAGCSRSQALLSSPVRTDRLRPPGAVSEETFTGRCIRCGRCMEVCPYHCIKPLDVREGINAGTPIIEVRKSPCFMCMMCVEVCPTGALLPIEMTETRMGLAIIDTSVCAAHQPETMCRTCYSVCPLRDHAIELVEFVTPRIIDDACTGCGICVQACPVELSSGPDGIQKAIRVEPKS